MRKNRIKIFVAMSGGVDSSVAAALLKKSGFDVCGVHIKMWQDPTLPCSARDDRLDAMRVAAKLGIPYETWDFTEEYKKAVVDYMILEYALGRTPNPDIMCNRNIKFGIFLKKALERGADFIATGHYVRREPGLSVLDDKFSNKIVKDFKIENCKLKISKDTGKDQSYFLWTLTQRELKHCLFPIGNYTKVEVRKMAQKFGLPTAYKPDSQGVCFIGEFKMRDFLERFIPKKRGRIVTASGKIVGEHMGLAFYTIGQRAGLGIGAKPSLQISSQSEWGASRLKREIMFRAKMAGGIPYYVAEKDFKTNTLVVAEGPYDKNLYKKELRAIALNWIAGRVPKLPLKCKARIRYRQQLQFCEIVRASQKKRTGADKSGGWPHEQALLNTSEVVSIRFAEPQRAVAPGQSVVFYQDDELIGGGIIEQAN